MIDRFDLEKAEIYLDAIEFACERNMDEWQMKYINKLKEHINKLKNKLEETK